MIGPKTTNPAEAGIAERYNFNGTQAVTLMVSQLLLTDAEVEDEAVVLLEVADCAAACCSSCPLLRQFK
jgi:hypothetical protein